MNLVSIEWWRNIFHRTGRTFGLGCGIVMALGLVGTFGLNQYSNRGQGAVNQARSAVLATVNGEPITQSQFQAIARTDRTPPPPGEKYAQLQAQYLQESIAEALIRQEARKRHVRVDEADVDRAIAAQRSQLGKDVTDEQWATFLDHAFNMTPTEYRESVSEDARLLYGALMKSLARDSKATEEEARNENTDVKLTLVLVPTQRVPAMPKNMPKNKDDKALPDAEAKKKAEELLAKAKAGADLGEIARKNSGDFMSSAKGGEVQMPEYRESTPGAYTPSLSLLYGKEFQEALHKVAKGQFTDVVKASGFQPGYVFAKLVDRSQPKGFDIKKAVEALKEQRASEKFRPQFQAQIKAAKVVIKDPDKEAFYDYSKLQPSPFGQPMADAPLSPSDKQKLEAKVNSEFEAMLKRDPPGTTNATTAARILADSLKPKMNDPKLSAAQREQIRAQLISLEETVLKSTEDRDLRFELGDLYRAAGQPEMAEKQYAMIARLLNASPPYNLPTMEDTKKVEDQLVARFNGIATKDSAQEAAKAEQEAARLTAQIAEEKKKEAEKKAATKPPTSLGTVTLPPGGTGSVTNSVKPSGTRPGGSANSAPTGSPTPKDQKTK